MTVWQRFQRWRQSRPFWGGLLTVLAGLEIIGSMNLDLAGGHVAIGGEGYLIAFALLIAGPLAWYSPGQRHFYGLIAAFVAVYSLIGVNLGGFFVGMLLGVTGGGLIFAWSPSAPSTVDEPEDEEDPQIPRHAAMVIAVLALSLSMIAAVGVAAPAIAGPCAPATTSPSPRPSPSQSPGSGGILGDILDIFGRILNGGKKPTPTPTPKPSPSPCPTPSASPSGSASAPPPSGTPTGTGAPGSVSPTGGPTQGPAVRADQAPVAKRPARMTGTRVTMFDLRFVGVVELPTIDGSIRVLKFSMAQSDTDDFLLHVYGNKGWDTQLRTTKLTVKGDIVFFYTSRFQARLLGLVPVDYRPDNLPPPIPLPFVFFTEPDVQLVFVDSPVLTAPQLRISLVRAA